MVHIHLVDGVGAPDKRKARMMTTARLTARQTETLTDITVACKRSGGSITGFVLTGWHRGTVEALRRRGLLVCTYLHPKGGEYSPKTRWTVAAV